MQGFTEQQQKELRQIIREEMKRTDPQVEFKIQGSQLVGIVKGPSQAGAPGDYRPNKPIAPSRPEDRTGTPS